MSHAAHPAAPAIEPEAVLLRPDCAAVGTKRAATVLEEPPSSGAT